MTALVRTRTRACTRALAPAAPATRRAWWLASLVAATPVAAPVAAHSQPALGSAESAAKLSPLLSQVLERVAPANRDAATGEGGLFRRLAQQHKAALPPADKRRAGAGMVPALVPALGYAMEQLDPASFAVLRPIPVAGSGALLRTGDVFVLQFSTSLPGQVRLENIDAQGRVADLGTHTVFVDQLNRIPRDKGIQLRGQPGLERLRFYFYPCMPPEAAGMSWAAEFQGKLPPCAAAPVLQSANAGSYATPFGTVVPRALVNLAQPDANLVFAGSPEYQPGDVTVMEAQIRHEGRDHAR